MYVRMSVGEDVYEIIKKGDIGDIVGVKGTVFMTNTWGMYLLRLKSILI